jgi:hypothetical protein
VFVKARCSFNACPPAVSVRDRSAEAEVGAGLLPWEHLPHEPDSNQALSTGLFKRHSLLLLLLFFISI